HRQCPGEPVVRSEHGAEHLVPEPQDRRHRVEDEGEKVSHSATPGHRPALGRTGARALLTPAKNAGPAIPGCHSSIPRSATTPGTPRVGAVPQPAPTRPCFSVATRGRRCDRSEEHTSELQSRENLVCRLLL